MIIEEQPKKSIPKNKKVQTCPDITSQKLEIAHTLHDVTGNGNRRKNIFFKEENEG